MTVLVKCFLFSCLLISSSFFELAHALVLPAEPVAITVPSSSPQAWKIRKPEWSAQDERNFQSFVSRIGAAVESRRCRTVTECLASAVNPYWKSDPPGLVYKADCADFPYYLRAYFAWKNGLPFSFATKMGFRDVPGNGGDIRYSRYGNKVLERFSASSNSSHSLKNAFVILNQLIRNNTSSANFRFHYADDGADFFPDYYPVEISKEGIRVGTVIYDPNGHVAIVHRITEDGKIYYIDAHPDNSITAGAFGKKFVRSHPGQGAGFKNFRPLQLVGAQWNSDGYYSGGQIVALRNQDLRDFSVEQFFGNWPTQPALTDSTWSQSRFVLDGQIVSYYDYVRSKLAQGTLILDPVKEMQGLLQDTCEALHDRVLAVELAIQAGMHKRPHPERLPENIYGTSGDWETYSTPSRDAQLKVAFNDLLLQAQDFVTRWKQHDPALSYSGADLPGDLLKLYNSVSVSCQITYTNSAGYPVSLNFEQIRQRLFRLSFDPYHCVELRWGASSAGELASCPGDDNKLLWYEREQRLRNQEVRQYEDRTDFTLDDLLKPLPGNGKTNPPDVDLPAYLKSETF